jgi:protocatechuate 3,4-dioxygenase beta subunit
MLKYAGVVVLAGCDRTTTGTGLLVDSPAEPVTCTRTPGETAGPFPGDGTNGANALALAGIVRSDIRSSLGGAELATGVPLTVTIRVVDVLCQPLANRAVYLWQNDRDGNYSMYEGLAAVSYLRGVQITDADGSVTFTTVFPGCYPGRWPHLHFSVYDDATPTATTQAASTSQLALTEASCDAVFATAGYEPSAANYVGLSIEGDGVFGDDGAEHQLAEVTGSVDGGFVATLTVALS